MKKATRSEEQGSQSHGQITTSSGTAPSIQPTMVTHSFPTIAKSACARYGLPVAANSAAGFGDPSNLAHKRPIRKQALFLCPQFRVMAAVRGIPSGMPGSKFPVRQPAYSCHPKSFGDDPWQLQIKLGVATMKHTLNPSVRAQS